MPGDIPAGPLPIAIGCMRLSTAADRDDDRAIAVLHAALDAGVTLLDTANAYCWDDSETGHNERLIARALRSWSGDRSSIRLATKGGLTRPEGRWAADGRAGALTAACEASLRALDVSRIDLYQLHAVDPRVSLSTSVNALEALRRRGLIAAIGLCNVTVGQIDEARRLADIASVQVEVNLHHDRSILNGVVQSCVDHGLQLLAHRPLGGSTGSARLSSDPVLRGIGAERAASPHDVALAAIAGLAPIIVPLPGPTRVETARSSARVRQVALTDEDRAQLAARFPACRAVDARETLRTAAPARTDGEVVIVMGLPGAGKSTIAASLVGEGYARINRDEAGGTLQGLLPVLDRTLASGQSRVVLDNTYVSRHSRAAVVQAAAERGLPVRCVWLTTTIEEAQINAVSRILDKTGRLPEPEELRKASRRDPSMFGPMVQFRYLRELEPPDASEGFSRIDQVSFERRVDPSFDGRALIVWADDVLYRSRSGGRTPIGAGDVEVFEARGPVLRRYADDGWTVLGMTWQPEVADEAAAAAIVERVRHGMQVPIDIAGCPHAAGPPACWCRKPLPGLAVQFIRRYRLDPARCVYVGNGTQDPPFARRFGFTYRDASELFPR